jgi:tetratricopeptide (TPR) repeat protein
MNSYEIAMLYNFYGFIYYNLEQADNALASFKKVIEEPGIPESFEQSTLFTLAQLSLMQGNYKDSIHFLERWEYLNVGDVPPKHLFIKAQAYYQDKQYEQAGKFVTQAVKNKEAAGMIPDEGWLILQRAIYYELKQPEKVKDILVKMVKLFDEPKYWIQLAGMYGELGMEKHQLGIMEAAKQQGYLEKASDIFNMAQLYYYHKAPYKCAEMMLQAMNNGILEENLRNLKFLGQCYQLAKEIDKAVPVMQAAAALSNDGEIYAQLSQLLLNIDEFDLAIESAELAIKKGSLRNQGTIHLVLGMAYYNKREFAKSLDQLAQAESFKSSQKMAEQWQKFVSGEQRSFKQNETVIAAD